MSHKGSWNRVTDKDNYDDNYDRIFRAKHIVRLKKEGSDPKYGDLYVAYSNVHGIRVTGYTEEQAIQALTDMMKSRHIHGGIEVIKEFEL